MPSLEEGTAGVLHDALGLLLKLLGCGLTCLRGALVLNVGEEDVELGEVHVDLVEAVAHVGGEDGHHLIDLGDHGVGGGGHRIDLVSGY